MRQTTGRYRTIERIAASVVVLAATTLIACFWQDPAPSTPAAVSDPVTIMTTPTPAPTATSALPATPTPTHTPGSVDRVALVALYNATIGPRWRTKTNWLSAQPIGEWYGVTTDSAGRVTKLRLDSNRLSGQIPPELGNLANLTGMYIDENQLSGSIPPELGDLVNLGWLNLARNDLSGPIPPELGNLSNLTGMYLGENQLSGRIPSELGNLSNLTDLWLDGNQLNGELPQTLTALTMLGNFRFSFNPQLCAPVDDGFQRWLQSVSFSGSSCALMDSPEDRAVLVALHKSTNGAGWQRSDNWLSDRPIREWHGVTSDANGRVTELRLRYNALSGQIPPELGNLSILTELELVGNELSGPIPRELGNLSNLIELHLCCNQLSGQIPPELGSLSNLGHGWTFGAIS